MKINLNNTAKLQTLKGWGTSSCWWSQYCADEKAVEEISELLYGKRGLGLNIYRYNVGGGTDYDNCRVDNPWRRTESMYTFDRESGMGEYDFSRDKTAVDMMKRCLDKGNIDTLILFANSPHYSQTSTGQASGSLLYHTCNLPKANYRKFADYFLTVTQHFLDEGFHIKYISPINEPQWKWGGSFVWQEGCHYEPEELSEVYHIFAEEIIKRNMQVKLYGPESGEMGGLTKEYLDILLKDETVMQVLEVFAYHSYHDDNNPQKRVEFKNDIVSPHPELRFDMSEWCELPNKSHTKDFKGALITARIIGQDLICGGAQSWTSWVAVNQISVQEDGFDYSDGLLTANDDFSEWHIAMRYYGFAHFSKFIPVGSVCLDNGFFPDESNEFNAFSFLTPDNTTVTVVVNEGKEREIELDGNFESMTITVSNSESQLKEIYNGDYKSKITVPENSILAVCAK